MKTIRWLCAAVAIAAFTLLGCNGDDDSSPPADTPTAAATSTAVPTQTAVSTPTVQPTATATPAVEDHVEVAIGSDEDGGGQLIAEFDYSQVIPLFFSQCFGGSDEDCTGGQALFSDANPGFEGHHDHADAGAAAALQGAAEEIFPLSETAQITLTIVAIDEGLSIRFGETALEAAGHSAVIGVGPEFHSDAETLLLIDDRHSQDIYSLTFVLSADGGYDDSDEHTLLFQPANEEHHD